MTTPNTFATWRPSVITCGDLLFRVFVVFDVCNAGKWHCPNFELELEESTVSDARNESQKPTVEIPRAAVAERKRRNKLQAGRFSPLCSGKSNCALPSMDISSMRGRLGRNAPGGDRQTCQQCNLVVEVA